MSSLKIVGDPDKVCSELSILIAAGNSILAVKKTTNNATYIVDYIFGPMPSYLLMEDGFYLLLETNDKILLE